ncbi:MAG TPA: alpha/beta hydrolase [Alphaproteobacteria bacterium]|nr:alpha/beta hydrolase [Alphaproteobacteria bacterium]
MRTELVTIPTDSLPLDGALHTPENRPVKGAVLLFHGNTMNFYVGAPRFLPPALTELGFVCLAFNRRGHDILGIRDSRGAEGAAFQLTRESIADNRIAAEWMAARGFDRPVIIGHSNGGMLAVQHVADHPQTPALVLLSAHRGGKDQVPASCKAGLFAGDRLEELTAEAKALVKAGRGKQLLLMPGWWYVITAESFLDRLSEMPDVLALAPKITCPVLYIRGDQESAQQYPAEDFQRRAGGKCEVEIVPECDHFYVRREAAVTELVSAWLKRTLKV